MYALGKTKVFFRTGQVALLERVLHEKLANSTVIIQKIWKGYICRKKYQHIKDSLLKIQVFFMYLIFVFQMYCIFYEIELTMTNSNLEFV